MFANPSVLEIPSLEDEEFNLFHSIDRELYRKLIIDLGRDSVESMRVMALWMWLEQQSTGGLTTVKRMLSLPCPVIDQLANESVVCLNCAERSSSSSSDNKVFFSPEMAAFELKYLPELLGRNVVTKFFYDHRVLVLEGVTRLCSQVCSRAFKDINQNYHDVRSYNDPSSSRSVIGRQDKAAFSCGRSSSSSSSSQVQQVDINVSRSMVTNPDYMRRRTGGSFSFGNDGNDHGLLAGAAGGLTPSPMLNQHAFPPMVDHNLDRLLISNLNLEEKENQEVDPEDRTIFLTFSKGYPISETEVRDFFTRLYGDFIEEIHMQQVAAGEQALYARLVTRKASVIDTVVRGGKAKYNINGKHVCVRKFVKRNQSSSSSSSAPASSSSSSSVSASAPSSSTNYWHCC